MQSSVVLTYFFPKAIVEKPLRDPLDPPQPPISKERVNIAFEWPKVL